MPYKKHDGPKEGAKKRQAAFTERQKLAGLQKWQKWVTPTEAEALDALLHKMRAPLDSGINMPSRIFRICNAYESGYGHGLDGAELDNPYLLDAELAEAYEIGHRMGGTEATDSPDCQ